MKFVEAEPVPVAREPEVVAPIAVEAPRCAEHAEILATGTCQRCGRFCCRQCLGVGATCTGCERLTRRQRNPLELKRVRLVVKASFFFMALLIFVFGVVLPLAFAGPNDAWPIIGVVLSIALFACAALFAMTEARFFSWSAVAVEAVAALVLFLLADGKCLSWPFIAFPILTVLRLQKWSSLEKEARTFTGDR